MMRITLSVALLLSVTSVGCCPKLGYVPHIVKTGDPNVTPSYPDVKKWAYQVAYGYDTRSTLDRHALYAGALVAGASAAALTGLAAFGGSGDALIGIPIG